jgi:hypothetical protein
MSAVCSGPAIALQVDILTFINDARLQITILLVWQQKNRNRVVHDARLSFWQDVICLPYFLRMSAAFQLRIPA